MILNFQEKLYAVLPYSKNLGSLADKYVTQAVAEGVGKALHLHQCAICIQTSVYFYDKDGCPRFVEHTWPTSRQRVLVPVADDLFPQGKGNRAILHKLSKGDKFAAVPTLPGVYIGDI